jgi:hypothetical protein
MVPNAPVVAMKTFLTMTKMVVNTTIMVVVSSHLTTTHIFVVTKITTNKLMWSLYF